MRLPENTAYNSQHLLKLACYEAVVEGLSRNDLDQKEKLLAAAKELHEWVTGKGA